MALVLTEEQGMLRDSARGFISENAPVAQLRKLRDAQDADGFSRDLWSRFAEMGYSGVLVPEEHGGLGLGFVEAGVVMEQIGRHLTASPFLASGIVAATALMHSGSEAQKKTWLGRIASGECIATLAVDEASKHAPQRIALQAHAQDGGYLLSGEKTFVADGHVADLLIVAARVADGGIALFLVERGAERVQVERTAMVDVHNAARIVFDKVRLDAQALLGKPAADNPALEAALNAGRAAAAAELLGISDEVLERTTAYLKERHQFNQLIGEFQALQHRAAQLYVEIELTRSAVLKALQSLDEGKPDAQRFVRIAKARAGATATLAVQEGVQMHGGMGMTDEFEIGFFMKRARVLQELFGDANHHADQLARQIGY